MYTVTVESSFTASHQLTYAGGQTEQLHKHNWKLRVAVNADKLDENGLAIDFIDLKAKIDKVTDYLEDKQLEKLPCFAGLNASAENVARYIFQQIAPEIPAGVMLDSVEVMEAPGCWAKFSS